jgi:D-arabinose 1-dehydrogenase-like Zn-dependent alcohol dehydrogenase
MRRGLPNSAFEGRPQIAIANTASDLTPCNSHLNEVAEHVKRGVWEAGGVPPNLPVVSLGEAQVRPTAMLWRNMAAMAIEEMLRANPADGVVLLGGCDKTIPALLMAAASVNLPAVVVPGGPMLTGTFRGAPLGCGTDVWRLSEEVRAGTLSQEAFAESESAMIRSRGHCNTMGTASTMGLLAGALGMVLPGTAGIPAADSRLLARSHETGRLIVEMVAAGRRPSQVLTKGSFRNAIVALAAIGGSTNAVVHLLAIAGRLGVQLSLTDFDQVAADVPLLVSLQPAGKYLMEDMHRAGGLTAVLREVADLLDPRAIDVSFPHVLGHEVVGRRADTGERVVLNRWLSCAPRGIDPPCEACRAGRYPWCRNFRSGDLPVSIHLGNCAAAAGAHAERFGAHVSRLFAVPDAVSDEAAVLADPVSVSLRSILLAPPRDGQAVLVYGSGTLAFAAVALLRHLYPATEVWAATRPGARAALAARLGGHAVLSAAPDELVAQVARRVGTRPLEPWSKRDWLQDGPAVVYDTIGSTETVETSLRLLTTGGTLVELRRRAAEALRVDSPVLQGAARHRLERRRHREGGRRRQARHGALLRLCRRRPRSDAGHHPPVPAGALGRGGTGGQELAAHGRGQGAARACSLIAARRHDRICGGLGLVMASCWRGRRLPTGAGGHVLSDS